MAEPKFKTSEAKVKTPVDIFGEDPKPDTIATASEWTNIPEVSTKYPFDGQPVFLTEDGVTAHAAVWRTTRGYNTLKSNWEVSSFWAVRNGGGAKIAFEPLGYKRFEEPLFVPKKRL